MKYVVLAAVGLLCGSVAAAHAQTQPDQAADAAPERACLLVTQTGGQYAEQPLPGFEPALTSLALPAIEAANAVMVVCLRTTIIPEVTDYRVLTELHLPLSIRAGNKTLFLGVSAGKLQAGFPDGQATAEDAKVVQDRLDEMTAAMVQAQAQAKASAAKKK